MPFDMKRMVYGGFKVLVDAEQAGRRSVGAVPIFRRDFFGTVSFPGQEPINHKS